MQEPTDNERMCWLELCIPQLPNLQPQCLLGNDTIIAPCPDDPAKCAYGVGGWSVKGWGAQPTRLPSISHLASLAVPHSLPPQTLGLFLPPRQGAESGVFCKFFLNIPFQEWLLSGLGDGGILSCFGEREFWVRKLSLNTQESLPQLRLPTAPTWPQPKG